MNQTKTLLVAFAITACFAAAAQTASRFDVVITEIMADPTPVVALPNAEYLELRNVSTTAFNLNGWRISDAAGTATITASFVLQPDSMVILCSNSHVAAFSAYGRTIGVTSFPSLDNDGELLVLRSPQDRVIDAVNYSGNWYGNDIKKEGGWSLEMADPKNPCTGKDNWKASNNNSGGTPGKLNSVNAVYPDDTPPQLIKAYAIDHSHVMIVFNEPLDSTTAARTNNYVITGSTVMEANPVAPLFQSVQLRLALPLQPGTVYDLTANNLTDCKGNVIGTFNKTKAGLPQEAVVNDVVINEILFNPRPGAYDYVEIFNRSNKIIDASALYLGNRSGGAVGSIKRIVQEPFCLFPGDYAVITENKASLQKEYLVKKKEAVLELSSLPSFPDDRGTVVLLQLSGAVVDEVAYDDDWHFALISNKEGVALERLDPDLPSQNRNSWHSAAATAGYGTPTYLNSQYRKPEEIKATVEVSPPVFSPDNDGRDDLATIQYTVEENGYVANVSVFEAGGRLVRYLVRNELLSLKGFWNWDGLGENRNKLPVGTYIVYTEIFNLQGKKKSFKNTIVLARKLN